jgi:flagellar biosynthesis anti-sigma factor FlgM
MSSIEQILPGAISQPQTRGTLSIQKKYQTQEKSTVSTLGTKDEASLSESARVLAKAYQAMGETSEIRSEVVENLRQLIQSGEYQVPYEQLAAVLAKKASVTISFK